MEMISEPITVLGEHTGNPDMDKRTLWTSTSMKYNNHILNVRYTISGSVVTNNTEFLP